MPHVVVVLAVATIRAFVGGVPGLVPEAARHSRCARDGAAGRFGMAGIALRLDPERVYALRSFWPRQRAMGESWIVGINPVEGALANDPARVREVLIEQGTRNPRVVALADAARRVGIEVHARPRTMLDRIAGPARHQGVAANYATPAAKSERDLAVLLARDAPLFLVLDGVTDPHNLGACLRSAAAAGAAAVIVPRDRAAGITPVVRRASAGAVDRVPLVEVTNLARSLRELKDAGVWLTGLVGTADASLYDIDLSGRAALVLGSEGEGLRRLTRDACDRLAKIPMPGAMESLNVSVAAGVALFEAVRQRRSKG